MALLDLGFLLSVIICWITLLPYEHNRAINNWSWKISKTVAVLFYETSSEGGELPHCIKKKRIGPVNRGNRTQKPYMARLHKGNARRPQRPG